MLATFDQPQSRKDRDLLPQSSARQLLRDFFLVHKPLTTSNFFSFYRTVALSIPQLYAHRGFISELNKKCIKKKNTDWLRC